MKKSVAVVSLVAALAVGASAVAVVSAQQTKQELEPTIDLVESSAYYAMQQYIPPEEQKAMDTAQDEAVDIYQNALKESKKTYADKTEWVYEEKALLDANKKLIIALSDKTVTILQKYGAVDSEKKAEDFHGKPKELITIACDALERQSLELTDQAFVKLFINQTYLNMDSAEFRDYVGERIDLSNVPYIDLNTMHSYDVSGMPQEQEEESSR